jgi:hypothetical protein
MKRSGFQRPTMQRVPTVHTPIAPEHRRAVSFARADMGNPITTPKEGLVRSEPYRRLVAAMPCKACGIQKYSQAAHPNAGKAKGSKADDRLCFALCVDRPGVKGCHPKFDQYEMGGRHAQALMEQAWGEDTRRHITAMGQWPANLEQIGEAN